MLPVGPLQHLDVLGLVGFRQEDISKMVGVDDLGDILIFVIVSLRWIICRLHLGVLRLFLVDPVALAYSLWLLRLEWHWLGEYRDVLHPVLRLGLLVMRRGWDFRGKMDLTRLRLHHLL